MRSLFLPTMLTLSSLCASCVEFIRTPGVLFSSSPPGARVVIDGEDSGFVTPCHVDVTRAGHEIDLVLDGYKPASVRVDAGGDMWLIHWDEAWISEDTWHFPLWLNARDAVFPVKIDNSYDPARIFVRLRLIEGQDRPRRGGGREGGRESSGRESGGGR